MQAGAGGLHGVSMLYPGDRAGRKGGPYRYEEDGDRVKTPDNADDDTAFST